MIVAIDGPAASGKSTVARAVAMRLGFDYLDTGAMYRAVAWGALSAGIPLDDDAALGALAASAVIRFVHEPPDCPLPTKVLLAGEDVTLAIRTPEADAAVSPVAKVPAVRTALVAEQRRMALSAPDWVVEGRDIGTVVFPDAAVKVFLEASAAERARRRHEEQLQAGHGLEAHDTLSALERRDRIDSTREASPLAIADDAVVIDTTRLTASDVTDAVIAVVEERR